MCILLKLHYAKFYVSRLFCSKVIEEKRLGLNFNKSYQIWGKLAQEQKSYRQQRNWGWKTIPPVFIGLKGH